VRFPESGEDADTLIRRIVAAEAHPEEILVVTSDKALYSWCKTRGARALRAHEWNALAGRPARSRSAAEKPDRETDVEGWLKAFGAGPRAMNEEEEPVTERPTEAEFAPYFGRYVALVPEADIIAVLEQQGGEIVRLAGSVPAERESHRYAEGKWTIREVLGHLVDAERVFGYRVFCISRGEQAPRPSTRIATSPKRAETRRRSASWSTSSSWCAARISSCCADFRPRSGFASGPRAASP